jgi:hypothetical protein
MVKALGLSSRAMKRVDSWSAPHPLGKTEDALDSFRSAVAAGVSVSGVALRA